MGNNILFVYTQSVFEKNYIVIIFGFIEGGDYKVHLAFKYLVSDFEKYHLLQPLETLKLFSEKYGLFIKIGYHRDIFIYHQTFWVDSSNPYEIVKIENPNKSSFIQNILLKINKHGNKHRVDCHLGFCIDKEKYLSDLKGE